MLLPRRPALAVAVAVLATGMLTSCSATGRHVETFAVYTPAVGANNRDAQVDVLGAVIVSKADGSGTFIATLVNNDNAKAIALTGLTSETLKVDSFEPRSVPARGLNNLANDDQGIVVTGDFMAGQVVPVTLALDNGETVPLKVPVVVDSGDFAGLDLTA